MFYSPSSCSCSRISLSLQRSRSEPQGYPGAHGDDDSDDEPPDEVRLWEDGWKDRYYQSKFGVEAEDMQEFRVQVSCAWKAEGRIIYLTQILPRFTLAICLP